MRLILPPMWLSIALSVSGCWNSPSEFMREPFFSPVGAGLAPEETAGIQSANALAVPPPPSTGPPPSLYSQPRIAWQTKRLGELDAQVKQRLADLEKAEMSMQEWVAKRDALLKAASDDLVAIYARMQPENAAVQLSAMDDQMAAAILGKLKPSAAGAILDEMEAERASKLASFLSGMSAGEKKS